jgi:hypothetical protein
MTSCDRKLRPSLTMAALIGVFLMTLAGCSATVEKPVPVVIRFQVPASLEPREVPGWTGETYRDLLDYTLQLQEAAAASEADKRAARKAIDGANGG